MIEQHKGRHHSYLITHQVDRKTFRSSKLQSLYHTLLEKEESPTPTQYNKIVSRAVRRYQVVGEEINMLKTQAIVFY